MDAWKVAHDLVISIYKVLKSFPKEELFGLISQMKRCSISITSNIAEGFSRGSEKEKAPFYRIALGSVTELQNQLLAARDIGYLSVSDFKILAEKTIRVQKLIHGLLRYLNS